MTYLTHPMPGKLRHWKGPVERRDRHGNAYVYWERRVPRIPDEFLESVIYLYPSEQAAVEGHKAGGSGFLVTVLFESFPSAGVLYAVTCSHVVGKREGNSPVVRVNKHDGTTAVIDLPHESWVHHPYGDDVAVCPIGGLDPRVHEYRNPTRDWLLTREKAEELKVGAGDDVYFMGRFISREGKSWNLPTVRFGTIASTRQEPVSIPERGIRQESFLVEARSLSGYSGSPVFLHIPPGDPERPELEGLGFRAVLGIDFMHFRDRQAVREPDGEKVAERWWVEQNSGMMGIVPAWKILETLESEEAVEIRDEAEKELKKQIAESSVSLDAAEADEFVRFESLTRKLVQVPKKELDEQREKDDGQ